jgi:hypothetical protein
MSTVQHQQQEEWKIQKRGRACALCARQFKSEEEHYSGIVEVEGRFERRDICLPCWAKKPAASAAPSVPAPQAAPALPAEAPPQEGAKEGQAPQAKEIFSFWKTRMPKIEQRKLEDIAAMVEFFKKLIEKPSEDPSRQKVTYLMSLLLARKRRVKLAGSKDGKLRVEKTWDGETIEIVDPPITDAELADLRQQMEAIFDMELGGGSQQPAASSSQPESSPEPVQ